MYTCNKWYVLYVLVECQMARTIVQRKEQRLCIKFCVNLEKNAMVTLRVIQQALGDQIFSRTQVFQWHVRFKTGRTSVEDEHQGGPQASQLLKLLHEFKSSSVRIDVGPFATLLRRWEFVMAHAKGF
jgi:hypothetical protein